MNITKLIIKKTFYPILSLLIVSSLFFFIMKGNGFSFYIPWNYSGDANFSGVVIKSLIDSNNFLTNPFLGFPHNGFQLYDFPIAEFANISIIYLITFFSDNYTLVLNVFYFLTFILTTLTSLYTCQRLGLNKAFSLLVSVLFVFAPYHFFRNEGHLFLSAYYAVPIYTLMAMSLFLEKTWKNFVFETETPWKKIILLITCILFFATSGVYYAFFGCYFILIAGIYKTLEEKNINPLLKNSRSIGLIIFGVLLCVLPCIIHTIQHGQNFAVIERSPAGAEQFGLKIIQLLAPSVWSGFSFMQALTNKYYSIFPANESISASLGIIGSIGFLLLFFPIIGRKIHFFDGKIRTLSILSLSAVLLGTGLGAAIAFAFFSNIRCYNRISIFILYFSLLALTLMIQKLFVRFFKERSLFYSWLVMPCILIFGLYTQIGHYTPPAYQSIQQIFKNDAHFVQDIESRLPANSAIYQLPYFPFPESPPINTMPDYAYFRGYLHSHQLRWSAAAMKGRPVAIWQESVSTKPLHEFLNEIILAGFSGLYIDRSGYADQGKTLESELIALLNEKPLMSPMNDLIFFDLRQYAKKH
jgi:phosphoglycerol transferase